MDSCEPRQRLQKDQGACQGEARAGEGQRNAGKSRSSQGGTRLQGRRRSRGAVDLKSKLQRGAAMDAALGRKEVEQRMAADLLLEMGRLRRTGTSALAIASRSGSMLHQSAGL